MATRPRTEHSNVRDDAICAHLPLVRQVAQRFHLGTNAAVDLGDLVQFGVLGLIDATEKFDASKGASFTSYARYRIKGSILDGLRRLDFVPRSVRRRRRELAEATQRVEQQVHGEASAEDVAGAMDLDADEFRRLVERVQGATLTSVEELTEKGLEAELNRACDDDGGPDEALEHAELKALLIQELDRLPEKERTVLALYYFEDLTMREVGDVLGVTESRVSQLHAKAVRRLRTRLAVQLAAPAC